MFTGRGVHYYHQIEQSDCGVTCLRMVARHFGRKIPVKFLRSRADLSRGGISVRGLKECAESIGMKGYGVKLGSGLLVDAPYRPFSIGTRTISPCCGKSARGDTSWPILRQV